jgi:cell wall-associated NlpC family hydrolase
MMSKCQQWFSSWLCLILTLLVLYTGQKGSDFGMSPVFLASAHETHRLEPSPLHEALFPVQSIESDTLRPSKGATLEDLRLEDQQALERKKRMRAPNAESRLPQQYLLTSRSIHLAQYAQYEKARRGQRVAQQAKHLIGKPYVWGGTSPNGFDCSGFTQYVYSQFGIEVPRSSYDQFQIGMAVDKNDLQPGDLVFFSTYAPGPSHLGIYVGDGQFVHALNQQTGVITSTLNTDYYRDRFLGAKRLL